MTKSKYVPKRRFKEFVGDGEWEQKILSELAEVEGGGTPSTVNPQYWDGDIDWYTPAEIGESVFVSQSKRKITVMGLEKSSAKILPIGTVLFTSRAGIGKTAILAREGCTNQGFQSIVPKEDLLASYFVYSQSNKLKQYGERIGSGSTFVEVSGKQMSEMPLIIPSIFEQKKLGDFFQTIDSLISNHQHKLDKLKNLKNAYLSELFPAEGERVPKRRFPGFEGEWEQKRLKTIASMHARIGWQNLRTSEFLNDGDYYLITGTDFLDGRINFDNCYYVDKERYQQDKNIQVKTGSILITKDGTIGKVAIVSHLDKPATLNAGIFNVVIKESNVNEKYLYQYLASPFLMDYVSKRVTGGTIKHLNQGILVDFPINIPVYEEQKAIGRFLEHLDQSITLQQQKLDKLKDLKKAYLNELFV